MSEPLRLLSIEETIAAAAAARARAECEPWDTRRALDVLSAEATVSLAYLAGQLDAIAEAAARAVAALRPDDHRMVDPIATAAAADDLIRQLTAAGYLPLPITPETEEAACGQA